MTGRSATGWLQTVGHASCLDAWLGTLEPGLRRARGIAIDGLFDEVVYRQLELAEERPTLAAAVASLSEIADEARADPQARQVLAWLLACEPRLRDLGALFVHAALRRARGFPRAQRFYPAVMLQRILDTIHGETDADHGTTLVWNILLHHAARARVDEVIAAAAPIPRGYEGSVAWPTPAQAARLCSAIDSMRAPWEEVASSLLHAIEPSDGCIDEPLVAGLAGGPGPLAPPVRESVARVTRPGRPGQERLLRRALAWPRRSEGVLGNLAAEHGLQRLYYAYLSLLLEGLETAVLKLAGGRPRGIEELTPEDILCTMPELFERECVWPMAIAMDCSLEDELVDLCADEPTLEEASRTRLKRQRESCLARPLQLVDDETMQILDYIHVRFYRQEVDA